MEKRKGKKKFLVSKGIRDFVAKGYTNVMEENLDPHLRGMLTRERHLLKEKLDDNLYF